MAEGIGVEWHSVSGTCDLCGDACDPNTQELNVLTCTFKNCQDLPYHQDCLEKYLKSIRLERNRKTGFKCPRGCGKGSAHKDPCPGKIDKSHPIHPRNEEQKKKKKAKLPEVMAVPAARPVKTKEEKKQEKAAAKAAATAAPAPAAADKGKAAKANAKAVPAAPASHVVKARPPPPPDPKLQLAAAVAAARRELAAGSSKSRDSTPPHPPAPAAPEYKTLDMYYRENAASSSSLSSISSTPAAAPPVTNAWATKPPVPAAPSALSVAATAASRLAHSKAAESGRLQPAHSAQSLHLAHSLSHYGSRAESPTAQLPPPPPPPPPPPVPHPSTATQQPPQQQQPVLMVSGLQSAGSLQQSVSSPSLQSGASLTALGQLPVGMEYADDEQPHLTKAQRKNLKRAEKKKKGGQGDAGNGGAAGDGQGLAAALSNGPSASAASSSTSLMCTSSNGAAAGTVSRGAGASSSAAATGTTEEAYDATSQMYELAVQALLANKTLALVASLQRLGFAEWQAAAAVQRHGSDLEEAVAWLLDGGAPTPEAAASVSSGCVAEVDIHEELSLMDSLAAAMPNIPHCKLYQTVADTGGDLDATAAVCVQVSEAEEAASEAEQTSAVLVEDTCSSQQQVANSDASILNHSSDFAAAAAPSLYNAAAAATAADASQPAVSAFATSSEGSFANWLGGSGLSGLSTSQQYGQQQLGSSFGGLQDSLPASSSAAPGPLGFLQAGTGSAGLGSSIWATNDQAASSSASTWAAGATGAGSLFATSDSISMGIAGNALGLGVGTSGLGLLQQQSHQQLLTPSDPVLSLFSNSTTVGSSAANDVSSSGLLGTSQQQTAPSIQQSRLFQSYGWRQQPLFGGAEGEQQQQQTVHSEEDQDLEGLMATLMCH